MNHKLIVLVKQTAPINIQQNKELRSYKSSQNILAKNKELDKQLRMPFSQLYKSRRHIMRSTDKLHSNIERKRAPLNNKLKSSSPFRLYETERDDNPMDKYRLKMLEKNKSKNIFSDLKNPTMEKRLK
jgi:hypothetical protein